MNRGVHGRIPMICIGIIMVYQREALQLSYEAIGNNLGSTVCRTVGLFLSIGKVDKKKYNADNLPRKLTDNIIFYHAHCAR